MLLPLLVAALVASASAPAPVASPDPVAPARADLSAAQATLRDNFNAIDARSGIAAKLQERLDVDKLGPGMSDQPAWMSTADFADLMITLARLDRDLIDQYATGTYRPLADVQGVEDTVFKSPVDGTMQPLAAYVPKGYDRTKATSLVVFLHGRTWSENTLIAQPWVRAAADSTGSIVIAPFARGDDQYVDPAPKEVYAALDAAKRAFNIDPRRIYLAGHSMGAYGVFIVAPLHPQDWAGALAASGGMTTETLPAALRGMQGIPVYLVVGSDDPIVPKGYMRQNADLLTKSGIETHYYEQPGGLHSIGTIAIAFDRAWRDMLVRQPRSGSSPDGASPSSQPQTPSPLNKPTLKP